MVISLGKKRLTLDEIYQFVFNRQEFSAVEIASSAMEKVSHSRKHLEKKLKEGIPIYGVTTGYGAQCENAVSRELSTQLQENLISYLHCGTGAKFPKEAVRACQLIHLNALSGGFSAVRPELIERLKTFVNLDILAEVPLEGSLGASGDLIPMSYIANALIGRGNVHFENHIQNASELPVPKFELAEKEGLSLVNGVSMMLGMSVYNLKQVEFLLELSILECSWLYHCIQAKTESLSPLINSQAKEQEGQSQVAQKIRNYLEADQYTGIFSGSAVTADPIQDKYSVRCAPQILGPVQETLSIAKKWIENECNSCSDNPVIDERGNVAHGGNFYGSYIAHSMDYLKISVAHMSDLLDRQLTTLVDRNHNRGLSNNLVFSNNESNENIHHGIKGLHQAVNALAAEVNALAIPNSIFSRSSENHNQDKVSLGMSAANQLQSMIDKSINMHALNLICLSQALDLREISPKSKQSQKWYQFVRDRVSFVSKDRSLNNEISLLIKDLKAESISENIFSS